MASPASLLSGQPGGAFAGPGQAALVTGAQGSKALTSGEATTSSGVNSLGPVLDLLTKLTKGDQGDVTQATQPEIDQITQQFDQIRNLISMAPRGGGKTTALAEAPFQKAGDIQRTEGAMRTDAAGKLGSLGSTLAGIGVSQEGVGAQLEGTAAGAASSNAQINEEQSAAMLGALGQLGQGLGSVIGGYLANPNH
jgi:hypothetical protein